MRIFKSTIGKSITALMLVIALAMGMMATLGQKVEAATCYHPGSSRRTITIQQPTCTQGGKYQIKCGSCGEVLSTYTVDKLAHKYCVDASSTNIQCTQGCKGTLSARGMDLAEFAKYWNGWGKTFDYYSTSEREKILIKWYQLSKGKTEKEAKKYVEALKDDWKELPSSIKSTKYDDMTKVINYTNKACKVANSYFGSSVGDQISNILSRASLLITIMNPNKTWYDKGIAVIERIDPGTGKMLAACSTAYKTMKKLALKDYEKYGDYNMDQALYKANCPQGVDNVTLETFWRYSAAIERAYFGGKYFAQVKDNPSWEADVRNFRMFVMKMIDREFKDNFNTSMSLYDMIDYID
ncbi:MAG: hypothetical protein J5738_03435 [Lachnospiraceae bacterium]|nr:hypothetical protein [Lachnospiraceae bacterium]